MVLVMGARPNFIKGAPLLRALERNPEIQTLLVHTGQHYDPQLSDIFFQDLEIRTPDACLGVGSGSHAVQTAEVMIRFERFLHEQRHAGINIDRLLVVGDINSTLGCTLVAAKAQIPIAHIEAGLRCHDRSKPEEVNRVVTDALSDLLFCSEPAAVANLRGEGRSSRQIHLVGNVMIDTLQRYRRTALERSKLAELGLAPQGYAVVTIHRPANVDSPAVLEALVDVFHEVSAQLPVVFAVHPRTRARLESFGLLERCSSGRLILLGPQGYLDFLCLTSQSRFVLTDSGGLQEETTALGVPCLTLQTTTERPITIGEGSNRLIGSDMGLLRSSISEVLMGRFWTGKCPQLWDGKACERIVDILAAVHGHRAMGPAAGRAA